MHLPKIKTVKLKELPGFDVTTRILSVTVSRDSDRWFVSFTVKEEHDLPKRGKIVGVDLGIKDLAILSDGTVFENPRPLQTQLRKLSR